MTTKILQNVSFFSHLREPELQRILSISLVKKYSPGELIFTKEQTGNHLFVVRSGSVKIYTGTGPKRRKTLAYLGQGDFFGEMALLGGKTRSASAQAITETELIVINREIFKKLIFTDKEFTMKILYTLSERLRKADKELESMLFQNILGRLVRTLVALSGNKHQTPITLALSRQELADCVGTTREPLSRAISILRKGGLVDSRNKHLIIKNLERLKAISK